MLEEMNDNLLEADGNVSNSVNTIATENSNDSINASSLENNAENSVIENIAANNAAESEDDSLKERHEIPMLDYEALQMDQLVEELQKLISIQKVTAIKEHVEEIKKSFMAKFNHMLDEKKQEFYAENPGTTEDFQYHSPLKNKFDQYYNQYKDLRNSHYKSIESNLKNNLTVRLEIVEELKELVNAPSNIKDVIKQFNDLRAKWKNAGPIPKDKYNHVWNNYHFHLENFYDFLHLDREMRDIDFKHNLDQKRKIIARVEELLQLSDVNKAFRELQDLHRIWKEEIGPVSKEFRDEIWNQFSDLTKKLHDKREKFFESLRATEVENLNAKNEIINKIEQLATEGVNTHSQWLQQIEKVEQLRGQFFSTGKVPAEVNEQTWESFKQAVRNFNAFKNSFYKDIKKDQNENLNKKMSLVARANELKDSDDFANTTPIMKQIQDQWKQIGHVPRKYSDKIWADFKDACNHYFDRLKEHKNAESSEEIQAFENKKAYLETLKDFKLIGEHRADLDAIKKHIENWKQFGKVPFSRRHIEGKFNKILDALFEKLSLSKKESEMVRFNNRLEQISETNDARKLESEKIFLIRKIEEIQGEIFQLENNIQFFTNAKNAKKENSFVIEVRKNIAIQKENLATWKEKLRQLNQMIS